MRSPGLSFCASTRPLVFAHRGGCQLGPENTLAAFDLGLGAGADGLELDVHLSRDGVPVVHHDATLDRCTNERGPIAARTAAELARVDAGYRFARGEAFPFRGQSVSIPTLFEVLRRYRDVPIIIEMKVDSREMGEAVARVIREADAVDRVCAAGFGAVSAAAVRAVLPEVAVSACRREVEWAVYGGMIGWSPRRRRYQVFQVPERFGLIPIITPRFVRQSHAANVRVQVWTVDDEADMRRLLALGVDGLISDRPDLAVEVRNQIAP